MDNNIDENMTKIEDQLEEKNIILIQKQEIKILIVGNGINLALSENPEKYNILSKYIKSFFKHIKFKTNEEYNLNDDTFSKYVKWLKSSSFNQNEKKIFDYYSKFGIMLHKINDLETVVQMYTASIKFNNLNRNAKNNFLKWIHDLKEKIIHTMITEKYPKEIGKKLNQEYNHIFTTNYDNNIELMGVNNVKYLHGSINNINTIEIATFKKHIEIFSSLKEVLEAEKEINIRNKKIIIDLFGIYFFNEVHILNVFLKLKQEYKKIIINHYIYAENEDEYESKQISNLYLNYFYGISWGDEIKYWDDYDQRRIWTLGKEDQFIDEENTSTFFKDEIIWNCIYKHENIENKEDAIKKFKYIFNFIKTINSFTNTDHFLSGFDISSFASPSIDFDITKL